MSQFLIWVLIAIILIATAIGAYAVWRSRVTYPTATRVAPVFAPLAADTAGKRGSAMNLTMPWRCSIPLPDGAIAQPDRQHVSYMYSGILAGAPVVAGGLSYWGLILLVPGRS